MVIGNHFIGIVLGNVHACMCVREGTCTYVYMHECMCVSEYTCMHMCVCVCVYIKFIL